MSRTIYAVKKEDEITRVHVIEVKLIKKDIFNERKPLIGENTSRGVIKTGSISEGTISFRITNSTAPIILYLITGIQIDYSHVPETRSLYKRTLEINYEQRPEFSLLKITEDECIETPELRATGFTIIQGDEKPLILEIKVKTNAEDKEAILPEISSIAAERFFYLKSPMKIDAEYDDKSFTIDSAEMMVEKPLVIEAESCDEYEANRTGRFIIETEEHQFEKILKSNGCYRSRCYGKQLFYTYNKES